MQNLFFKWSYISQNSMLRRSQILKPIVTWQIDTWRTVKCQCSIMVSYDLPIVCYCRDFFFEKINKVCLDFLEVKILTSWGRILSGGNLLPTVEILRSEVNILTDKKSNNPCLSFQRKNPVSKNQLVDHMRFYAFPVIVMISFRFV